MLKKSELNKKDASEKAGGKSNVSSVSLSGKSKLTKKQKDFIFVICLSVLPLVQYGIFYLYVNINTVILSFQKYVITDGHGVYSFVGLDNFKAVWSEFTMGTLLIDSITNSLKYYFLNLFLGTTLALVFSYYIYKRYFGSRFFKVMLFLPSIVSSIVLITLFKFFSEHAVPELLSDVFGIKVMPLLSNHETSFGTVLFYTIWTGFGTSILLYTGSMSGISPEIIEAGKMDGVGLIREFISIVIPLIFPTLSTFLLTGFTAIFVSDMNLFSFFGEELTTNRDINFGYYLLRAERRAKSISDFPKLAALGVMLTCVAVPLTFCFRKLLKKFGPSID